jgi:hypothetical protein
LAHYILLFIIACKRPAWEAIFSRQTDPDNVSAARVRFHMFVESSDRPAVSKTTSMPSSA